MKVNEDIRAMVAAYCRTIMNIKETLDSYKPVTEESSIYEKAEDSAKKFSIYHYEGYLNGLALSIQIVSGVYFSAPNFYLSKETKLDEMKIAVSWTDEKFIFHAGDYSISNIIKHGYEGAYEAADKLIAFVNEAN